jgi:hypothetical protein
MSRFPWTLLWFLSAIVLVLATIVCGTEVFATGMAHGDMIGTPASLTAQGQQSMRQLERENNVAAIVGVVCLVLASVCFGTGLRSRYKWSFAESYIVGFVACPALVIAIPWGALALRDLFHP